MMISDHTKPNIVQTTPTPHPKMFAMNGTTFRIVSKKPKIPFRPPITNRTPKIRNTQSSMLFVSFSTSIISSPLFLPITSLWKRLPFLALNALKLSPSTTAMTVTFAGTTFSNVTRTSPTSGEPGTRPKYNTLPA